MFGKIIGKVILIMTERYFVRNAGYYLRCFMFDEMQPRAVCVEPLLFSSLVTSVQLKWNSITIVSVVAVLSKGQLMVTGRGLSLRLCSIEGVISDHCVAARCCWVTDVQISLYSSKKKKKSLISQQIIFHWMWYNIQYIKLTFYFNTTLNGTDSSTGKKWER